MPDSDLNIASVATEIGNDLFGAGEPISSSSGEPDPGASPAGSGESPAPLSAQEVSPPVPDIPLPKAWKKEKEPLWAKLDREAREYIQAREEDMVKGLSQYSASHKSWSELVQPFQPVLQQYPDVNPVQLLQNLMRNHLAIVQGTPEQKKQLASQLLKSYGIELDSQGNAQQAQSQLPPEVHHIQQELASVRQVLEAQQRAVYEAEVAKQKATVEAFASDPKNKYFDKVQADIVRFIQTGAAQDLPGAYELACYANPEVRALMLADQQSAATPQAPVSAPRQIEGREEGTPSRRPPKSIEDTIASVVSKHYSH